MKISLEWLTDYVELKTTDAQDIADALTASTGEVDDVEMQGKFLDHCCVGKVQKVLPHPNADKLKLVDVETDKGVVRVVCGGTNVVEGMLVAFAHVGATVKWHGGEVMTLAPVKIRGEESKGMICAAEELDLGDAFAPKASDGERPIVDLTERQLTPGTDLRKALGLSDAVLHVDNHAITNRPDLFSHVGIARELVALGLAKWKKQKPTKHPTFPKTKGAFKTKNEIPKLIPRYLSCHIEISGTGETPDWMKRRLAATGWRSVNLPVDITNYVMMELGMPLHSFDAADISGDVVMRTAKKGEKIKTLDEVDRSLPEGAIVLSDDKGIFDLLGIMGGLRSSTKASTRHIYLHSAVVDSASIRRAIIATGHRTDASTVYEKSIQHITAEQGFYRALELFLQLVPGAKIVSSLEELGNNGKAKPIELRIEQLNKVIGIVVPVKQVEKILTDLGCSLKKKKGGYTVTPPLWRLHDLQEEYEIIEEVARIYGYGNIFAIPALAEVGLPPRDQRINNIRYSLKDDRYFELLHLAFNSPALLKKTQMDSSKAVRVENALGEELSLMRMALLPSLLETAGREIKNVKNELKLFEYGSTFATGYEGSRLCALVAAKEKTSLGNDPMLTLKADIVRAYKAAGYELEFEQKDVEAGAIAHPGRCAAIVCQGVAVGCIAEVHPAVVKQFDLPGRTAYASVTLATLFDLAPAVTLASPLPQFPAISYDVTVVWGKVAYADVVAKAKTMDALLENVQVVDLFEKTDKRVTLRFTYRAKDKTLEEKDVQNLHSTILKKLELTPCA